MNNFIDKDLIYINSKNCICFKDFYNNTVQVYMNSFKLQKK